MPGFAAELTEAQLAGKALFIGRCIECHEPPSGDGLTAEDFERVEAARPADDKEAKPTRGPSLAGLVGRPSGSVAGYVYSDAMKAAGLVWDVETLRQFLLSPATIVPKTKMPFKGLKRPGEVDSILAYLDAVARAE